MSDTVMILGYWLMMCRLPKPLRVHLRVCDKDLISCVLCNLIEYGMFREAA